MLLLKLVWQRPSYCGPACLEMVSDYFGSEISQKEWARHCGTTLTHGTPAKKMVAAAKQAGFDAMTQDEASFSDIQSWLKKKIPVIVNWFSVDEGHYSVAVKLDKKNIWLADPEIARVQKMDRKTFFRVWFDFHGDFMQKKNDIILRRMLVLFPREGK
ncbi:MAG: C39 family peptidase [Candidatus Iainarchaeum archaeon]|uniref:C39 family peptidase n=1 Tax=Candidatus Iainarchaeum sp. TaxID=3101447 RepID=A0A7T9DJ07_9ARCH|nr:MAG: C39 family peptidase [Candidatus Diapherotrites archaeon]